MYCSGDMHGGNTVNTYDDGERPQVGYENAKAAVEWTKQQFGGGGLEFLNSFVLSGLSAGSLGVQLWATTILDLFAENYKESGVRVIADSFIGVVPQPEWTMPYLMNKFKLCNIAFMDVDQEKDCTRGNLLIYDMWEKAIAKHPAIKFASVNSKYDETQIMFANAFALLHGMVILTPSSFYKHANEQMVKYEAHPNHVSWFGQSGKHTYFQTADFYMADIAGGGLDLETLCQDPKHEEKILEWVTDLRDGHVRDMCYGKDLPQKSWPLTSTSYCASELDNFFGSVNLDDNSTGCEALPTNCFPGEASVVVRELGATPMDHLEVGSEVEVAPGRFEPVLAFLHAQRQEEASAFLRVLHESGELRVSEAHLVFVSAAADGGAATSRLAADVH